tara:strand:- start:1335 stop:1532 length:198 start_codon:yes stop_codon:yes gene_type:complete
MSKKYYTRLSNDFPEIIEVKAELTREELASIRRITDSKPTATFSQLVKALIKKGINTRPLKVTSI